MTRPIISLQDLKFSYKKSAPILAIDKLDIERGETVFLHGPSGSGKTTMLGIIAGILRPTSGSLKILDVDSANLSDSGRDAFRGTHMGYIFQQFNLISYLNVLENITLTTQLNPSRLKRIQNITLKEEATQLADKLGIAHLLSSPVDKISVGEQQRVAVARALCGEPEIIVADEPTSALDAATRDDFLQLLFSLTQMRGTTLVFVSHDLSLQSRFSRKISLPEINSARGGT